MHASAIARAQPCLLAAQRGLIPGGQGARTDRARPAAHAQVSVLCRSEDDDFLLLASDGLWDVMTNQVRGACMHLGSTAALPLA